MVGGLYHMNIPNSVVFTGGRCEATGIKEFLKSCVFKACQNQCMTSSNKVLYSESFSWSKCKNWKVVWGSHSLVLIGLFASQMTPQIYKGDPRPRIPPCVMASSAMGLRLGVFGFLPTTHAKTNAKRMRPWSLRCVVFQRVFIFMIRPQ